MKHQTTFCYHVLTYSLPTGFKYLSNVSLMPRPFPFPWYPLLTTSPHSIFFQAFTFFCSLYLECPFLIHSYSFCKSHFKCHTPRPFLTPPGKCRLFSPLAVRVLNTYHHIYCIITCISWEQPNNRGCVFYNIVPFTGLTIVSASLKLNMFFA